MERLKVTDFSDERKMSPCAPLRRRTDMLFQPRVILIGASTGGPQALIELLTELGPAVPHLAVCVTLHMPPDLVPIIASHVSSKCRLATKVVRESVGLEPGIVHFAPGDRHLTFARAGRTFTIAPAASVQRDFCKPAVDAMFAAGAATHGSHAIGIVLSGMGTDGLAGARAITNAGGLVLVQDKETSAVWGMPGAVAKADLASVVLAPRALAKEVMRRIRFTDREA